MPFGEPRQLVREVLAERRRVLDDALLLNASIDATADAHASTWPEYVSPPAKNLSCTQSASSFTTIAPSGT